MYKCFLLSTVSGLVVGLVFGMVVGFVFGWSVSCDVGLEAAVLNVNKTKLSQDKNGKQSNVPLDFQLLKFLFSS